MKAEQKPREPSRALGLGSADFSTDDSRLQSRCSVIVIIVNHSSVLLTSLHEIVIHQCEFISELQSRFPALLASLEFCATKCYMEMVVTLIAC